MNAIKEKCRPKHQVLVLKCYPRTTKGAVDVKPNSSELSYLLFYAISRRSKIQKVGNFLEKKTASDIWRLRIGNVQVTLQILKALIEKAPKDLPLFAQNVLKVLGLVLRSNDITMVEASLPTFETFCEHHDTSSLFADQNYIHQYEEIVRTYASFASTRRTPGKGNPSQPVIVRWRNAGLGAIRSVADSDALASVAGRQLNVIVPMILENLWTDNEEFFNLLSARVQAEEKSEAGLLLRRRTSVSTVRTAETPGDTNPIALSGSTADADRLAEEDTGVLALQCLKQIFVVSNRAQLHGATQALIKFIKERLQQDEKVVKTDEKTGRDSGWAIKIFELVARWAPVQDRYVILITAMDSVLRAQASDETMNEQIVLVAMIGALLRSDVNLIGLSVMDVLLGLLQHMKRVLKYSARNSIVEVPKTATDDEKAAPEAETSQPISALRKDLLDRIQHCIGDLATHVYYADQITDMISAILIRLKPHPSTVTPALPVETTDASTAPGASVGNLSDDQHQLDSFFAFDIAKTAALRAIKSILLVANPKTKISGNASLSRNKVPIQVWEGTHWILRDPIGQVRKAYADAVITWLDRETTKADLIARDEMAHKQPKAGARELSTASFARRAISNASAREKPAKIQRSHFLQLFHLAVYDNALQFVDFDVDIALCHVILAKLVSKLGVNAVRYGLPMVYRLQEDIQDAETPLAKVRLGALCHGYFWALADHFDFESSVIGRAIQNEIVRRRSKNFWVEGIQIPPPQVELIGTPGPSRPKAKMPVKEVESEALLPFDDRLTMVDCICTNYAESRVEPPTSPAASPGRPFNGPILSSTLSTIPAGDGNDELPAKMKEDMVAEWTRDAAVAALQQNSKSTSLNGSKTGTATVKGNRLTVGGSPANGYANNGPASPAQSQPNLRPASHNGAALAFRKSSVPSRVSGRSTSSRGFVASVDQLKSVLSGDDVRPPTMRTGMDDDDSDSMVSFEYTPSEVSYNPDQAEMVDGLARSRSKSRDRKASGDAGGPLTSHPPEEGPAIEEPVPPVPPLPSSVSGTPVPVRPMSAVSARDHAYNSLRPAKRNIRSRGGDSLLSGTLGDSATVGIDLQSLLKGIDSKSREHTLGNLTKPPY